jgi:hypothetical protein
LIKQKFNQWFDKEDKSKLPLGALEQVAREYGGEGDIRIESKKHLPHLPSPSGP